MVIYTEHINRLRDNLKQILNDEPRACLISVPCGAKILNRLLNAGNQIIETYIGGFSEIDNNHIFVPLITKHSNTCL